ncbi:LEA type 2 family protein [Aliidiomarina quisquiliarum]|uniref:LEA type 2 family protein n=1 Tax=Aliidiomarina quisquiliarum TaxID=2938947 RepID=UPI00208EAEF7|nr:LEA type 2 family protein [Aliidiomarina quisquiliarum]MCO4320662.1 LEA type 2 family protein [Aliidiomarina quisquiliarum]
MKQVGQLVIFALAISMLYGCTTLKQQLADTVKFRLEGVDITMGVRRGNNIVPDITADLAVQVEVNNNSPIALTLMQMNYNVFVGNSLVGQGANQNEVKVAAQGGRNSIVLNISLSAKELLAEGIHLSRDKTMPPLRIEGSGVVNSAIGSYNIPFTLRYNDS